VTVVLPFAEGGYTASRIEAAFNHAEAATPSDWTWTDLSDRLQSRRGDLRIPTTRGRGDEVADTEPSQLGPVVLDNADGALTPGFATSPWWPAVDVGLPVRYWEDGTTPALLLPGKTGAYASTPDHPDFDVVDLDLRIRIEPDMWSTGIHRVDNVVTFLSRRWLASRWTETGDERGWVAYLIDAGWPSLRFSPDGAAVSSSVGTPTVISALVPIWVALTVDADDGAGNRVATWWRYDGDSPPDDVTTWDVVVQAVTATPMVLHPTTAPLAIGAINAGADATWAGRVLAFQMRDAINGTVVANPDFTGLEPGTTSFTDAAGKDWTLAGDAAISRSQLRFCGEATAIEPFWPYGDNHPLAGLDDPRPTEARVALTARGVLGRLTTGQDPLRSPLTRAVTARAANVVAYWPCEDGRSAVQLAAGIPDVAPLATTGLTMAADDSLPAAGALPSVPAGEAATWIAPVSDCPTDAWTLEVVLRIPTPETAPTETQILGWVTSGSIAWWHVTVSATTVTVTAYDPIGGVIDTNVTGLFDIADKWILFRFDAVQDGSDVDWAWTIIDIDTGSGGGNGDTITGETIGGITYIGTAATGPPDGMSFGHLVVHDGALATGWLAGADTAWAGETAAHRFWRLCDESGIPAEIIGDPDVAGSIRGDLAWSQAMGPQGQKTLAELLADCAAVDLGIIIENTGHPGLIYRCRHTLEDQAAVLSLDAATNDIADLAPVLDTQGIVNTIQVTSTGGSSAVAVDDDSVARRGRYSDSVEVNGVGGLDIQTAIITTQDGLASAIAEQNGHQAGWRLALGTTTGLRYPSIVIDLRVAPHLIDAWLATRLGDRITLTNLPVQHPTDLVDLLVQHAAETVTPSSWVVELTVSPGEPWLIGELVE